MFVFYSLLLGVLLLYLWLQRKFFWMTWKIGGSIGFPFIGMGGLTIENCIEILSRHYQLHNSPSTTWYGPFCVLYVSDPVNTERILTAPECINKGVFYYAMTKDLGDGLLSISNPEWSVHRRLLNPMFKIKTLHQLITVFKIQTEQLCESLQKLSQLKQPLDIKKVLKTHLFSISCENILGLKHFSQNRESEQIMRSYDIITKAMVKKMFNPIYYFSTITKLIDIDYYNKSQEAFRIANDLEKTCIEINSSRLSEMEVEPKNEIRPNMLLHIIKLVKQGLLTTSESNHENRHILMTSFESTSVAFLHIITLLAMHPEWQDKLFYEIQERFSDEDVEQTFGNIQDDSLVDMVIKETLRLLPVVPAIGRKTTADFLLSDDVVVPKGTNVLLDIYSMHRNPKYWGADALEFNPHRFLRDEIIGRHPYAYMPFSKGPRKCIGWIYATILLKVLVINVFRRFRFTTTSQLDDLKMHFNISSIISPTPLFEIEERISKTN